MNLATGPFTVKAGLHVHEQASAYASPWSLRHRVALLLWEIVWATLCRWTPKPLNPWRLLWLRVFGCRINGDPFVHQRARIHTPWNLTLSDRACVGDGAVLYSLGRIELGMGSTIAQECYLCTGSHDFGLPHRPLVTGSIRVADGAFIGARAFVLPGISIGDNAIVGACSVVTRDVPAGRCVAGNPARSTKQSQRMEPA